MENNNLLPVGTTLQNGKYRIKRQLASGGFGNTYEIYETQFEETFAMKEFYLKGVNERDDDSKTVSVSNAENTPEFVSQKEKFKKEALRLLKLDNPHVVRVYDLFEENETAYYVMDFLKGDSLSACMKKAGRPLSEQEVIDYTQQVLAALEAVHAENIWHLDLKPGNIMTDGEGKAVLIDFGASKQFHDTDGRSLSTSTGLCYTPGFAPTEQIESNTSRMGPWTDLYALGATMYNLLTMKTPPSVSDIQDGEGFDFPENVSPETQRMIRWLMEPNRKRRPQSVD
jgi:serine/threonine protein kinase